MTNFEINHDISEINPVVSTDFVCIVWHKTYNQFAYTPE